MEGDITLENQNRSTKTKLNGYKFSILSDDDIKSITEIEREIKENHKKNIYLIAYEEMD